MFASITTRSAWRRSFVTKSSDSPRRAGGAATTISSDRSLRKPRLRRRCAKTGSPRPRASRSTFLHPGLPQLLVDVTVLARQDLKTGIERVVRAVLRRLLEHPPSGFRVEPVVARDDRYVYARAFTCGWLGLADALPDEAPIDVGRGDVFLGLDWAADVVPRSRQTLARYRAMGLEITFVVYDLLPLLHPDYLSARRSRRCSGRG